MISKLHFRTTLAILSTFSIAVSGLAFAECSGTSEKDVAEQLSLEGVEAIPEQHFGYKVYSTDGITIVTAGPNYALISHGCAKSSDIEKGLGELFQSTADKKAFKTAYRKLKKFLRSKCDVSALALEFEILGIRRGIYASGDAAAVGLVKLGKPKAKRKTIPYKILDMLLPTIPYFSTFDVAAPRQISSGDSKQKLGQTVAELIASSVSDTGGSSSHYFLGVHNLDRDKIMFVIFDVATKTPRVYAIPGSAADFLKEAGDTFSVPYGAIKLVNQK